jgi:glycine C-acetyltransferase
MVMVDDSHASGFIGKTGRGTHEHCGVMGRVDIITSTLGKALGGAMGGFTSGKKEVIEMLRQRSRPYLFSNSLSPSIVGAASSVLDLLSSSTQLRDTLEDNTQYFKKAVLEAGFDIKPGDSPIVPIMLYDAKLAQQFADKLLEKQVYAIGFFYPVVGKGQARIRVQISASHTREHLDKAIEAFVSVGKELGVLK